MLKIAFILPMIVLGTLLAMPATARELSATGGDVHRVRQAPDLEVRPRGQREQIVPDGDANPLDGFDDSDIDGEGPDEIPIVERLP